MQEEEPGEGEAVKKARRGERGGTKAKKQAELKQRFERGEFVPKGFAAKAPEPRPIVVEEVQSPPPVTAEFASASSTHTSGPCALPPLSPLRVEAPPSPASGPSASASRHQVLTSSPLAELRPSSVPVAAPKTAPSPSLVNLLVLDYHHVLDVCRPPERWETISEEAIPHQVASALKGWLEESFYNQIGVCSYIGKHGRDWAQRRENAIGQIQELNRYLASVGVFKQVGLKIVPRKEDKGPVVVESGASTFCDDQVANLYSCQGALGSQDALPQLVWYTPDSNRSRADSTVLRASSFSRVLELASGSLPRPAKEWRAAFPGCRDEGGMFSSNESNGQSSLNVSSTSSQLQGVGGNVSLQETRETSPSSRSSAPKGKRRPSSALARVGWQTPVPKKHTMKEMFQKTPRPIENRAQSTQLDCMDTEGDPVSASGLQDAHSQVHQVYVDARSLHSHTIVADPQIVAEASQAVASARQEANQASQEAHRVVAEISRQAREYTAGVTAVVRQQAVSLVNQVEQKAQL